MLPVTHALLAIIGALLVGYTPRLLAAVAVFALGEWLFRKWRTRRDAKAHPTRSPVSYETEIAMLRAQLRDEFKPPPREVMAERAKARLIELNGAGK